MKFHKVLFVTVTLAASTGWGQGVQQPSAAKQQPQQQAPSNSANMRQRFSYAFGMMIGRNLNKQSVDIDMDLMVEGFKTAFTDGKLLMTEQQAMEAIQLYEKAMAEKQAQESQEFLLVNKKKPNVKTTPSGLQYKVVKEGKGPKPRLTDAVKVNYRGTFINGNEFDSSMDFTIPVNDVIDGWKEALQLMPAGSRWQALFVPAELAYGENGQPPIGPNATLIFDLELLEVAKQSAKSPLR